MKTLTLIRHAKSSWRYTDLSDEDRPLNKRGNRDAPMMGKRLAERGFAPDRTICSPALRALRTAQAIYRQCGLPEAAITLNQDLFHASDAEIITIIEALNPHWNRVALVGHNPGFTLLANYWLTPRVDNLPTCAVAALRFACDRWDQLKTASPVDVHYDFPKNRP